MKEKERLNLASGQLTMQSTKNMLKKSKDTKRNHISSVSNNNINNHNTSNSKFSICIWRRWINTKLK